MGRTIFFWITFIGNIPSGTELTYIKKKIHRLKVVSRYCAPQLQVGENDSYVGFFQTRHFRILIFKHWFNRLIKQIKNACDQRGDRL